MLGDATNVRADRSKQGRFHSLMTHPEFRDLVIRAAPVPPPTPTSSGQMMRQTSLARRTPSTQMSRPDPDAVDYAPPPIPMAAYDPTQDYRPAGESTTRPLIPVCQPGSDTAEKAERKPVEWLLWAGVLVVALITSIVAVFVVPQIKF